ncbi:MAG TPA: ATP synthase F1 subunit gamma [Bacteroidales bacterium]|nr:ATP synthase F1 subunit gamma [Bacteroidales bacterium]
MANLKEIRTRIASVTSTKQITSAMKMVSAAKLKKAQDAVLQLRPYADKLSNILKDVSDSCDNITENVYIKPRPVKNVLVVVITSNRGLCGGFNANAVKLVMNLAQNEYNNLFKTNRFKIFCIGKKGNDMLKSKKMPIYQYRADLVDKPTYARIEDTANDLLEWYKSGEFDKIILIYNRFKNAAVQILAEEQFIPVLLEKEKEKKRGILSDYIFEPQQAELVDELIPYTLKIRFYNAILDSLASEHGARMTAMHKATDNASELIKELTLSYNKARQATITGEILEIVGGAEALKG